MRRTELRGYLARLEEASAPEPSAAFVAKLEADLRATDQSSESQAARPRKWRRALVAAGPVAALTAAAAAAAVTLLPSDPHPREVKTANPDVTVPAPAPERPSPTAPTTTTVVAPPWLPPPAAAPAPTPTTPPVRHAAPITSVPSPGEHPTPTVAPAHEPVTTTAPRATTTTTPPPETLSLTCMSGTSGGNPVVGCTWGQSTSPSFKWYRLWRVSQGSSPAIVFQSDNRSTVKYYDMSVQAGTSYYYKVDVIDAGGNVIGNSNVVALGCC